MKNTDPMRSFIFKHTPEDFRVQEGFVLEKCLRADANVQYFTLCKSGLTTQAAIEAVARQVDIESLYVSYGGRKDEDGVTEQVIALPVSTSLGHDLFEREIKIGSGWIRLYPIGFGRESIRIGDVGANCFRTIVRNLTHDDAMRLACGGRSSLFCLNYYDTQRFGLPGQPKRTHQVGAALMAERLDEAAAILIESGVPEARRLINEACAPDDFFRSLEPRVRDFYLAAYESSLWNDRLAKLVRICCADTAKREAVIEGLNYCFVNGRGEALKVLQSSPDLPYRRYDSGGATLSERILSRPTVIQVIPSFGEPQPDPFFPGNLSLSISFVLPSGCYATMVLRQIELQLERTQ